MRKEEITLAKWMRGHMPTYGGYKCSKCGYQTTAYKLEECPNCHEKMYTGYVGYVEKGDK